MITTVLMIISGSRYKHFHVMIIIGPGQDDYHSFTIIAQPYQGCITKEDVTASKIMNTMQLIFKFIV